MKESANRRKERANSAASAALAWGKDATPESPRARNDYLSVSAGELLL